MTTVTQNKVQVRTDEKPITFTTVELGNFSREKAEHIKKVIEAKAGYMNFKVLICPYMGSCNVLVETSYKEKKDEILGQLFYIMATLI